MAFRFAFYDQTRERKGVLREIPEKGIRLYCYLLYNNFFKLVRLNLLYLLFCLPVITIPAASGGLARVLFKLLRTGQCFVFSDFYEEFKTNFMRYTCMGFLFAAGYSSLYLLAACCIETAMEDPLSLIGLIVSAIGIILLTMMNLYAYTLMASVKLQFLQTLKNAFLLSIAVLSRNVLLLTGITVFGGIAYYLFPLSIFGIALIGFSMAGLAICQTVSVPVRRYITEPYTYMYENNTFK